MPTTRQQRGATAFHGGQMAEAQVAAHYTRRGLVIAAERWRPAASRSEEMGAAAGEIDLIARDGDTLVFIEVKRADNFAKAAESLSPRQMARIYASASAYLALEPAGQATDARFDVALVDGTGRIEVIENAFGQI